MVKNIKINALKNPKFCLGSTFCWGSMTWERAIPNQKIVDINATFIVAFIRITHNFLILCTLFHIKPNTFVRAVTKRGQARGDQGPPTFLKLIKENWSRNRKYITSGFPQVLRAFYGYNSMPLLVWLSVAELGVNK